MGHVAFGLLFTLPVWFVWGDRRSLGFVALAAVASLSPDIDVWLSALFPDAVHHHGATHTILFVLVASGVGAAVFALIFTERVSDWLEGEQVDRRRVFVLSVSAFLIGGLGHVFADMLSAPDISTPIEPLWPLYGGSIGIDLVWYNARWINVGFLTVMVLLHVATAYLTTSGTHSTEGSSHE